MPSSATMNTQKFIDYLILSNKIETMLILLPQNYVIKLQFHIIVGMINEKSDLLHVLIED